MQMLFTFSRSLQWVELTVTLIQFWLCRRGFANLILICRWVMSHECCLNFEAWANLFVFGLSALIRFSYRLYGQGHDFCILRLVDFFLSCYFGSSFFSIASWCLCFIWIIFFCSVHYIGRYWAMVEWLVIHFKLYSTQKMHLLSMRRAICARTKFAKFGALITASGHICWYTVMFGQQYGDQRCICTMWYSYGYQRIN